MHKIGYARVSSQDQNLDRQIAALRAEGCAKIYREKASGEDIKNRPELEKAIDALPTKGILVLAEWDRATRSLMDAIHIMERVHKRGAFIKVLDRPGLDLTTPSGRGILALLSGLAEEERHRILKRANEGRIAAIKRGTKLGRTPKLNNHQRQEAIKRLKAGESCRAIAQDLRCPDDSEVALQGRRHVVIEFESYATAKTCHDSSEYQAAARIRDEASTADFVIIEGHED